MRRSCFSRMDRLPSGPSMMRAGSRSRWVSVRTVFLRWGELIIRLTGDAAAQERVIAAAPTGVDMGKVAATLDVIDQLTRGDMDAPAAQSALRAVTQRRSVSDTHFAVFAAAGAVALGVIFGVIHAFAVVVIALSAGLGGYLRRWLARKSHNPLFTTILCRVAGRCGRRAGPVSTARRAPAVGGGLSVYGAGAGSSHTQWRVGSCKVAGSTGRREDRLRGFDHSPDLLGFAAGSFPWRDHLAGLGTFGSGAAGFRRGSPPALRLRLTVRSSQCRPVCCRCLSWSGCWPTAPGGPPFPLPVRAWSSRRCSRAWLSGS